MKEFLALHQPGHHSRSTSPHKEPKSTEIPPSCPAGSPGRQDKNVTTWEGEEENNRGVLKARAEGCWRCDRGVAKGMTLAAQKRTVCAAETQIPPCTKFDCASSFALLT